MELDTASLWIMIAAALVLLMTPALGLFYGGMTRSTGVVNMMLMSFSAAALSAIVWILWGYSLSAGEPAIAGIIGNPFSDIAMQNTEPSGLLAAGFSGTFALISVAIISGAIADRSRFAPWLLFVPLWVSLVYAPVAFWIWGGGLLSEDGVLGQLFGEAIDFAGGAVVHTNAGIAALVLALKLGQRHNFHDRPQPHNTPLVMLGAALLWFGWFGFNAGAATTIEQAGLIWINTMGAPAAAVLGWILVEKLRGQRPSSVGVASGLVAGLVAITPSCADLSPWAALLLGLIAGAGAAWAVNLKWKLGYDDSLDVVGVHLVAGIIGTLYLGFFALPTEEHAGGLFYGGGLSQLLAQFMTLLVVILFSAAMTWIIATVIDKIAPWRVSAETEIEGIDVSEHNESGYHWVSK
ncbi:ammonia channel protein [Arthrobacter sp. MYb229]|uniref:ammonium transporter n=1 Tax=unclassified Arthrobacter TaxID=235627 RepID=UPI000CFBEF87|nr:MULTISPECIES: ammonium transporter [unclassified Arthrobacter]PRA06928.1 ammonia channel protein [Arthrobacter sp. MYb229]PRB47876.1 ammonia channel protein [Arthrobacter sp. MYb216]